MTIWLGKDPLILASRSRARQTLLANAGIPFEAIPADIDERAAQKNSGLWAPGEIAKLLAQEKALFVSSRMAGRYVVGADQTLALECRLFSKPAGRAAAAEQLRLLAGNSHQLHSAFAVARDGEIVGRCQHCADDHAAVGRNRDRSPISTRPARRDDQCRRLPAREGLGSIYSNIEGDHFTIPRDAAVPLLAFLRSERLLAV
jgi:septum formation protein